MVFVIFKYMQRRFPQDYYKQFFPKEGIPSRVYKYYTINQDLKNTLWDGYLWFSNPQDFNDPFDCITSLIDYSQPISYVKKLIENRNSHLSRPERRKKSRNETKDESKVIKAYQLAAEQM